MTSQKLLEAQQALQRGERVHARKLVREALLVDGQDEHAWLLMARLVDQDDQVIECLERALKINPQNSNARRSLRALTRGQLGPPAPPAPVPAVSPLAEAQHESRPRYFLHPAALPGQPTSQPASPPVPAAPPVIEIPAPALKVPPAAQVVQVALTKDETIRPPQRAANLSLLIGGLLILLVVLTAVVGQQLAPADPLEEHVIIKVGDEWHTPPFPAFSVPGFPLGSDQFGRDLLSRVLWAVRPTLVMVSIVAAVRLVLGTLIGLGAGWFNGRLGRTLDMLISAALAVPVLMVALGAIAMLGADIGLLAFIVGLSINGWGESARIVRDQTQAIKGQLYVEAAQALGSSTRYILGRHILRQIMPMVWMLLAFEISGTLLTTAGLGFLGYYIGGDVWIEVGDYVSRRVSGAPELGQMLATAWVNLIEPWPLVFTGTIIFITVLGFNLAGEGLRRRLNPEYINRNSLFSRFSRRFNLWFEERISYPGSLWMRKSWTHPLLAVLLLAALVGGAALLNKTLAFQASHQVILSTPGGQWWSSDLGDPYGTRWFPSGGPANPQVLWSKQHPAGFAGGPAVGADGTLYVGLVDHTLWALSPAGDLLWEADLPFSPVGAPALDAQGNLYVAGKNRSLAAVTSQGQLTWTFQGQANGNPAHGPVVSSAGVVYMLVTDPRGDTLFALGPGGELRWQTSLPTRNTETPLRLSPDSQLVYVANQVVDASDGSLVEMDLPTANDRVLSGREQFLVGGDGKDHLLAGHVVMQWQPTPQGFKLVQAASWNYRSAGFGQASSLPVDAGTTVNGNIWLFYSAYYGGTNMFWLDPTGRVLGSVGIPLHNSSRLVAVDTENRAYVCGAKITEDNALTTACYAYTPEQFDPLWEVLMPGRGGDVIGTAMAPGRLYVVTIDGSLYAIGDAITNP